MISSQGAHERFGGVVPEIASREHLELSTCVEEALIEAGVTLDDIGLVAATQGPGLVGALLVGLSTAKALAAARRLPFAAVDHLQGTWRRTTSMPAPFEPPFLCLIASGGHTLLARVAEHDGFAVLGRTLDDAAGEAFDKGARMLGLGYPGRRRARAARRGRRPGRLRLPGSRGERPRRAGAEPPASSRCLDFSFAGLKTALLYRLRDLGEREAQARAADLAASYQAAIVEACSPRAERALEQTGLERLALGGGVAANGALRRRLGGSASRCMCHLASCAPTTPR